MISGKGMMPLGNDDYNEEHVFDTNSSSGFFSSSRSSPKSQSGSGFDPNTERFSRKVFVGGLPPDIDEDEITASFRRFGPLVVDWPHKAESKSYFPPKGYAFLLFQVRHLVFREPLESTLEQSCFLVGFSYLKNFVASEMRYSLFFTIRPLRHWVRYDFICKLIRLISNLNIMKVEHVISCNCT